MNFDEIAGKTEKILRGRGIDRFEIALESSRTLSLEVSDGKVENFKAAAPAGVAIQVLKEGGMGFSYSTALDDPSLARMVENALVSAENQTPDDANGLPGPSAYPDLPFLFDPTLAEVPEEAKIERALELERLVKGADSRIVRVRKASYSESFSESFIRNSLGLEGSWRGTFVSSSVSAIAEADGDSRLGWDFSFGRTFDSIDAAALAAGAAARAVGLLGAETVETMRCPAILDTHVAAEMLEVLAPSFVAESVQKGKSLLAGRLGEKVFSPLLRIFDDALYPGGVSTAPFDGEGTASRKTPVVEAGILSSFLYDTLRARKEGRLSTGNSARDGVRTPPKNSITNFFIENGASAPEELLSGIDRGILLTDVMGMHTANPVSGDFSVGAAGFLIEKGRVTRPVKGAISGNVVELFREVEGIGNDLRFYGAVGSPSLRISSLDVSGR
jgi:PmbA protein